MNDQQFIRQSNILLKSIESGKKDGNGMKIESQHIPFLILCVKEAIEYRKIPKSKG